MTQTVISNTLKNELLSQLINLFHVSGFRLHPNRFGPKVYSEFQRMSLVALFRRSKKSLRDFVAELPEMRWPSWLDLKELPSKSSLHSWCKRYSVKVTRKLNKLLLRQENPMILSVDATGLESWKRSRHYEKRIGQAPLPYAKLDVLVDIQRFLIHDHVLRTKPRHDVLGAETMFKRTPIRNGLVLGDKGYDSEPLHEIAKKHKMTLFAPVRESSRNMPRGKNRQRCLQGHPLKTKRSLVESTIKALKAKHNTLRSKLAHMKKKEVAWNILIYNLERLIKAYIVQLQKLILDRACSPQPL